MNMSFLIAGLLLGIDSFLVCVPMGATQSSQSYRRRLALAFVICDAMGSLAGWSIGMSGANIIPGYVEWFGPAAVGCYGLYVLFLAWQSRDIAESSRNGWYALGIPVCLSLDNLVVGAGTDVSAASALMAALSAGLISGCLALFGISFGTAITTRNRMRPEWLGGTALVGVSIVLLCKEVIS